MVFLKNEWFSDLYMEPNKYPISPNIYQWLVLTQNLSEMMKHTGVGFSVKVLDQSFQKPLDDDILCFPFLSIDAGALVRKVVLSMQEKPCILANVVVPMMAYKHYQKELESLGDRPIGSFLHHDKTIIRQPFEFQQMEKQNARLEAYRKYKIVLEDDHYWARRSLFTLPLGMILVAEIFLNDLPLHPEVRSEVMF